MTKRHALATALLLSGPLLIARAACAQATPAPVHMPPPVEGKFIQLPHIRYLEITPGTGPKAEPSKWLTVRYRMYYEEGPGRQYRSLYGDTPQIVKLGQEFTLWDLSDVLPGMRVGEKRRVVLPFYWYNPDQPRPTSPTTEAVVDVELVSQNDDPSLSDTYNFLRDILLGHQRESFTCKSDGREPLFIATTTVVDYIGCSIYVDGVSDLNFGEHQSKSSRKTELFDLDPSSVQVIPTTVTSGCSLTDPAFTVKAASSSGKQDFSAVMDTEDNAHRLQRALAHAIALCGGAKSLF